MRGGHAAPSRIQLIATTLRWPGVGRNIARTAGFNAASTAAAGLGGINLARAVGPTVRGQYAAITAWFSVVIMVGGMGQPAALVFHVARDPLGAREYVATSRAMMLSAGTVAIVAGMLLAPLLAHGVAAVSLGYRIAFGTSVVAFVGSSYIFSLQARDLHRWNMVRVSQPVFSAITVLVLWRLRLLSLDIALVVLSELCCCSSAGPTYVADTLAWRPAGREPHWFARWRNTAPRRLRPLRLRP